MTRTQTPCHCPAHRDGAPIELGEHTFAPDADKAVSVAEDVFDVWRWECSCGARGRWQKRAPADAYHGWVKHVQDYEGEGETT